MRAFSTARARSDTPMRGRATQIALKTFHLWTTLSGGRADDSRLRRHMGKRQRPPPKGRRGLMRLHVFAFQLGKENLLAKTTIVTRDLTGIRGSEILEIAK